MSGGDWRQQKSTEALQDKGKECPIFTTSLLISLKAWLVRREQCWALKIHTWDHIQLHFFPAVTLSQSIPDSRTPVPEDRVRKCRCWPHPGSQKLLRSDSFVVWP